MTLLEIITVLAIISVLLSVGIGVYRQAANIYKLPAAVSRVSSILRAARNFSVSSALPSRVFVDPGKSLVTAFGFEQVAGWSFEDAGAELEPDGRIKEKTELYGAFRERGIVMGEVYPTPGKVGLALWFSNDGAAVVAEHRPRLNSTHGFSLEAWILFSPPERAISKKDAPKLGTWADPRRADLYAVIAKQRSYEMGCLGDGAVYVLIGDEHGDESFMAVTRGQEIVTGRWSHMRATFDGVELVIEVDGMRREWVPEGFELIDPLDWPPLPERVSPSDGDLTISHPQRFFMGGIDMPKVRVALEPQSYELPAGIFLIGARRTVRFDTRGSLDPVYHNRPVVIGVCDFPPPEESDENEHTAVAEPADAPASSDAGSPGRGDMDRVGDPLQALARYLAENTELDLGTGVEGEPLEEVWDPLRAAQQKAATGVGRIMEVIVDLTGTIRG